MPIIFRLLYEKLLRKRKQKGLPYGKIASAPDWFKSRRFNLSQKTNNIKANHTVIKNGKR
jgi:hypothetical protein